MKILYDNQIFTSQNFGGISRYFYELIRNLPEGINYDLPIAFSNNFYLKDQDVTKSRPFFENKKFNGRTSLIQFFNKHLQKRHFRTNYDLFHPTYYDPYFLNLIRNNPFVLTIHDMTYELFSIPTKKNDWSVIGKNTLSKKANKIIAVSENTKKDIVNILDIDPDNIKVIYHGCSLKPALSKTMELPERFILYVGDRIGYKNFHRLVKAFVLISAQDTELKLICTGKPFTEEEQASFVNFKIEKNILHHSVNDNQLAELYSSAIAFVFPSIYEGFGIPILEAFVCGCPVVLSDTSCFPEIAENAGQYFDPTEIDSIVHSLKSVIYDNEKRIGFIEKGFERITHFSWKKTALETGNLYKSILYP